MKSYIALTIEDLRGRIAMLNTAIEALKELDLASEVSAPTIEVSAPTRQPDVSRPKPVTRCAPERHKPAVARKTSGIGRGKLLQAARELVSIAAGLREPFSTQDLAQAAGVADNIKPVYGALYRWTKAKKWLIRSGPDQYVRTKSFPKPTATATAESPAAASGPAGRLRIPGLDPESLQERLNRAREELAVAESKSQETLARILRNKIGGLEAKIAEEA